MFISKIRYFLAFWYFSCNLFIQISNYFKIEKEDWTFFSFSCLFFSLPLASLLKWSFDTKKIRKLLLAWIWFSLQKKNSFRMGLLFSHLNIFEYSKSPWMLPIYFMELQPALWTLFESKLWGNLGQVGHWGVEHPGIVEGLEWDDLQGPSQLKPFQDWKPALSFSWKVWSEMDVIRFKRDFIIKLLVLNFSCKSISESKWKLSSEVKTFSTKTCLDAVWKILLFKDNSFFYRQNLFSVCVLVVKGK